MIIRYLDLQGKGLYTGLYRGVSCRGYYKGDTRSLDYTSSERMSV